MTTAQLLCQAYKNGEANGGSISWEDVDLAHEAALKEAKTEADEMVIVAKRLGEVFVAVFKDLEDSMYRASMDCRNNDASTALYEVHGALCSMDIEWHVRESLGVAHPVN